MKVLNLPAYRCVECGVEMRILPTGPRQVFSKHDSFRIVHPSLTVSGPCSQVNLEVTVKKSLFEVEI